MEMKKSPRNAEKGTFIRSSALSLKFANVGKGGAIQEFLGEYRRVVKSFVERFWDAAKKSELKAMPGTALCKMESWFTARMLQCAAKQAAGICRGAHAKNSRRLKMAETLWQRGEKKQSKKLRAIAHKSIVGTPEIGRVEPQLDNRFFKLETARNKWNFWLILKGFDARKRGHAIKVPLRDSKHWRKFADAKLLPSLRLSDETACFSFEREFKAKPGGILGVDIGLKSTLSTSAGVQHRAGNHGYTLEKINDRLTRRKKGSAGFKRAVAHRDNFIHEMVNKLNLTGGVLRLEKIKDMKRGKRVSRKLSHWSARDILATLKAKAQERGVRVEWVNPRFTSQRCSQCGWVAKQNRNGEQFECISCRYAANADLNAAVNISLNSDGVPPRTRHSPCAPEMQIFQ